ncbi:MAG: AsmA family protein [Fibrobacteria bacterium]|nr:AsmA family protein [Fibrobacteria bacterium]
MKALKKLIIAFIVLIILSWLGLYLTVKIAFPPEKIKSLVHEHGSKALGREVFVGGASIGVFPTIKLALKDITIANAEGFSEDPLFNLKEVVLALDFMSLVQFSPVIKEIRIVEADILYEVNKKGETNLDGLGGEAKPDSTIEEKEETKSSGPITIPAALSLKSFVINNARVRYRDLKTGTVLTLGSINQQVSVDVDKNLENVKTKGELVVSSISVSDKASGVRKGNIKISLAHDIGVNLKEQLITIKGVKFGVQDILIELMGKVNQFMTPTPGLDLKLASNEIKMASLLKEVPAGLSPDIPKLRATGFAKLNAAVAGVLDTAGLPSVKASLSLHEMGFGHTDLPAGINSLNGLINITENSVEIKDFGFLLDKHPVKIAVMITDLLKIPVLQKLEIDSRLDLGPLMALAEKFTGLPEGFSLSGQIQSNISASGKLDPQNPMGIKASGTIKMKDVNLATAELPDKVQLNGLVKLNNDKIEETLNVKIGNSDVAVSAKITDYLAMALPELAGDKTTKVRVDVNSGMLDLDQLLPGGSAEEEVVEEEAEPLTAFPALPKIDVVLNINLAKTQLMGLAMTDYKQTTNIKNGIVTSELGGKLYTGGFSQSLTVNLQDTTDAKIGMKLNINSVEANDFISRINDRLPGTNKITKALVGSDNTIYGKFSMNMDVNTNGLPQSFTDNLTGRITVAIHDGKLVGVKMVEGLNGVITEIQKKVKVGKPLNLGTFTFNKLDAVLEAKDGELIVKHCSINKSPAGLLDLTGSVGFDTKLNLSLENHMSPTLSKPILSGQQAAQGAVKKATGKLGAIASTAAGSMAIVPSDNNGRAIAYYAMTGTVTDPSFSVDYKRMGSEASGNAKESAEAALKEAARKKMEEAKAKLNAEKKKAMTAINNKKAEAQAKLDAEKKKLDAEKKKLEAKKKEAEAKAKAEADKKKDQASSKAKKKGKKALKNLKF